jgi:hypothetical protein
MTLVLDDSEILLAPQKRFSPAHLTSRKRPYGRLPAEATTWRRLKSLSMVNGIPVEEERIKVQKARPFTALAARCAQPQRPGA